MRLNARDMDMTKSYSALRHESKNVCSATNMLETTVVHARCIALSNLARSEIVGMARYYISSSMPFVLPKHNGYWTMAYGRNELKPNFIADKTNVQLDTVICIQNSAVDDCRRPNVPRAIRQEYSSIAAGPRSV